MFKKNMKIELTKEQYKNLVKLVYLGNWMINAIRVGDEEDPQVEKYNELEQYIFSFAKEAGLEEYIEFDEKYNEFFPTVELTEKSDIYQYLWDYNEDTFWQEIPGRLGERDFFRKYSKEEIAEMGQKERFIKLQEFIIKYEKEFTEHGIERLEIKKES